MSGVPLRRPPADSVQGQCVRSDSVRCLSVTVGQKSSFRCISLVSISCSEIAENVLIKSTAWLVIVPVIAGVSIIAPSLS